MLVLFIVILSFNLIQGISWWMNPSLLRIGWLNIVAPVELTEDPATLRKWRNVIIVFWLSLNGLLLVGVLVRIFIQQKMSLDQLLQSAHIERVHNTPAELWTPIAIFLSCFFLNGLFMTALPGIYRAFLQKIPPAFNAFGDPFRNKENYFRSLGINAMIGAVGLAVAAFAMGLL